MANKETSKPFSYDYVINLTLRNMISSCDLSIAKTVERIAEFEGMPSESAEVLKTLSQLHSIKRALVSMRVQ